MEHQHHHHQNHEAIIQKLQGHSHPEPDLPGHKHREVDHMEFDNHSGHHTGDFLKRFWVCIGFTVPVLLLSHMIQQWIGFQIRFPGDEYILLALSSVVYFYGGWPFLTGMIKELRYNKMGMMTLVAIAISVAFVYSIAVVFGLKGMDFFWELVTLIDIMLLGHWLEMRSQMAASKALQSLVALLPSNVHIQKGNDIVDVNIQELMEGDIVVIRPGEKIPADGFVVDGNSFVNESLLTGESLPVKKVKNTKVIAGSLNGDGALKVKVTGTGKNSYLSKVVSLVESAQHTKSRTQNLADQVAKWLTVISIAVGVVTFIYWYASHDLAFALERMVTVMVTSCPHALGVAIPLVVAISTTASATHGLLIRNRTAFENARKITTVIFDKTGTLTHGSHEVQKIISISEGHTDNEILQFAAAIQQHSEHYIAKGVLRALAEKKLSLWESSDFNYAQGIGLSGTINGQIVTAAGPNYFKKQNMAMPNMPPTIDEKSETVIYLLIENKVVGMITLADSVRESSAKAIEQLKAMGIKSFLLTGDNDKIAAVVAGKLGMDGFLANVLPHQKQERVKEFQAKGENVAMTGDGVNDAPALAQADVGIAIGSGTDVAAETADIVLVNSDPGDVIKTIEFGRRTYRKMIQNVAWAVGYNVVAIPLAAGVLYPSFMLSPAMGAVLMSLSTIIVAINARLLKL